MFMASRVYEKDVFMSVNHCMDLKHRLGSADINLPQVFIHGHLLGVRFCNCNFVSRKLTLFPGRMLTPLRN